MNNLAKEDPGLAKFKKLFMEVAIKTANVVMVTPAHLMKKTCALLASKTSRREFSRRQTCPREVEKSRHHVRLADTRAVNLQIGGLASHYIQMIIFA